MKKINIKYNSHRRNFTLVSIRHTKSFKFFMQSYKKNTSTIDAKEVHYFLCRKKRIKNVNLNYTSDFITNIKCHCKTLVNFVVVVVKKLQYFNVNQ